MANGNEMKKIFKKGLIYFCQFVIMYITKEVKKIKEKDVHFKVNEELYKKLRIRMIEKDLNIKEYFIDLIEKDLKEKKEDDK